MMSKFDELKLWGRWHSKCGLLQELRNFENRSAAVAENERRQRVNEGLIRPVYEGEQKGVSE